MFKVYYYNSHTGVLQIMFSPGMKSTGVVLDGNITENLRSIPVFDIELLANSSFYQSFNTMKDEIVIAVDDQDVNFQHIIFRGRIQTIIESFNEDGTLTKKITFEGIEACFNDILIDATFNPASSNWQDILAELNPGKYNISGLYYYGPMTGQTPSEYAEQTGRSYRDVIESLFKNTNYYLKSMHQFSQYDEGEVFTEFEVLEISGTTDKRFILGKHIKSLKITKSFDKLINKVSLVGDLSLIATTQDLDSINLNSEFQFYKKDDRYKIQTSLNNYANEILESYKYPQTSVELEYIDYDYLKNGQSTQALYLADKVEIMNPDGILLYTGYISEIKYNLFDPHYKKIILGNKESLFKEGEI